MAHTTVTPSGFDTKSYGNVCSPPFRSLIAIIDAAQVVQLSVPSGPSITLVEKGLHVTSIRFKDVKGQEHDIIVGSDDPTHYVDERRVSLSLPQVQLAEDTSSDTA